MTEQKRTGLDWEDVRVFIALARHGSMSAAARALGINHVTVSRRIAALEEVLGERLVERRPDGYVLTPAGTRALGPANGMESSAAILSRGGGEGGPGGLVRINAPPTLSQAFLVERLAALVVDLPALDIDVATDFRSVSLERRETDIAIRLARPQDGDVIAKHLITMEFGFFGSPSYCRAIAEGGEPAFVGFDEANAYLPEAAWLTRSFPRSRMSFRSSGQISQAATARTGAGLALLPNFLGLSDPRLQRCELDVVPPSREVWMVMRRQDRTDVSIRKVADYIENLFSAERHLFGPTEISPPIDRAST
ncbi:MAG: LysR family transcriptional regulator [Rhizobiaceae bacterium]|nr:LysR family transcriptional regulator [Rhizobiaceae bacterium]